MIPLKPLSNLAKLFEIEGRDRLLPMEGLRGVAVGLVFLQHYCTQFITLGGLSGPTRSFAIVFRNFGNYGVELFFVLSGFLIYGIIIRKRPGILPFMLRRAHRLYPAFIATLFIAICADFFRSVPKIPYGFPGAVYIAENIAFLPGLFPIEPLFVVNWSLSYEWWFYVGCVVLCSVFDLSRAKPQHRLIGIAMIGIGLVALSAADIPGVPIRGLSFLSGLLLVEFSALRLKPISAPLAIAVALCMFALSNGFALQVWTRAVILACGYFALCSAALQGQNFLARGLSHTGIRALGNISYSFYLVHGFAVAAAVSVLARLFPAVDRDILFWLSLTPVLAAAFSVGAALFLSIEKPFSLGTSVPKKRRRNSRDV